MLHTLQPPTAQPTPAPRTFCAGGVAVVSGTGAYDGNYIESTVIDDPNATSCALCDCCRCATVRNVVVSLSHCRCHCWPLLHALNVVHSQARAAVQLLLLLMRATAACCYCCNAGVLQEWAQIFKTGPYEAALLVSFIDEGTVSGCGWTIIASQRVSSFAVTGIACSSDQSHSCISRSSEQACTAAAACRPAHSAQNCYRSCCKHCCEKSTNCSEHCV
eukprot:18673-Heterococcus_DN1.PRE.2